MTSRRLGLVLHCEALGPDSTSARERAKKGDERLGLETESAAWCCLANPMRQGIWLVAWKNQMTSRFLTPNSIAIEEIQLKIQTNLQLKAG